MTSEIFGTDSLRNIAKNCLPKYEDRFVLYCTVLYAADKIDALRAENERLKAEVERLQISEVEQIARNISEMRAIQVRAENERLRGALEGYAKEDNWLNFEGHDVWQRDEPGSELATKALKGGGDA